MARSMACARESAGAGESDCPRTGIPIHSKTRALFFIGDFSPYTILKAMRRWRVFSLGLVCWGILVSSAGAALFDHSSYDGILRRYVDEEGLVDYASIHENSLSA